MKTYGQDVTDLLVFARDLVVDSNCPHYVAFSTHIGQVGYLRPKDTADLIKQLQTWLDNYHTGGVE